VRESTLQSIQVQKITMSKLIVVLGATGQQGGSVIDEFLTDPTYKIRGVTRDPSSKAGKELAAKGVDVRKGDLLDLQSLKNAFEGANVVYAMTTDFSTNIPLVGEASPDRTVLEKSYDMELKQGQNIVEAVLTILPTTLEKFIFSTLSATKKISKGKYTSVYHFDAKAEVVDSIKTNYPDLAKKTATLQLGFFANNWQRPTPMHPTKQADGTYEIAACGPGTSLHPFVDQNRDTAIFVHALANSPPQSEIKLYYGYSEMLSFNAWAALLSKALGAKVNYKELTIDEYDERITFHKGVGRELGEMYSYSAEYGYDGGEEGIIPILDLPLRRPAISMEEYVKNEDWSALLSE